MRKDELANSIEAFLNGTSEVWDWDDFISSKQSDPVIEEIRLRCANLPWEFPPNHPGEYCGDAGTRVLRDYIHRLRRPSGER
ncbi:MAG: hypothetical protein WA117_19445 [Verrucomicrobiia bacterium]